MNKKQLAEKVAEALRADGYNLPVSYVAAVLDYSMDEIMDTVADGEKITFAGFGNFEPRDRAERGARNPRTGESVTIPATTVPRFKPGIEFKRRVAA